MRLQILGVDKFGKIAKNIQGSRLIVREAILKETKFTGEEIVGTAKDRYLDGRPGLYTRSGRLSTSIKSSVDDKGDSFILSVGTNVIYARIHEYGGTIRPVKGRFLSWVGADGKRRFARSVRIPPRPFLGPAIKDNYEPFKERISKLLMGLAKKGFQGDE